MRTGRTVVNLSWSIKGCFAVVMCVTNIYCRAYTCSFDSASDSWQIGVQRPHLVLDLLTLLTDLFFRKTIVTLDGLLMKLPCRLQRSPYLLMELEENI